MRSSDAGGVLAALGAGELLLARATGGPLPLVEIGVQLVVWALLVEVALRLENERHRAALVTAVAALIGAGIAGPVGLDHGLLAALGLGLAGSLGAAAVDRLPPWSLPPLVLLAAAGWATLVGPMPAPWPLVLWALAVVGLGLAVRHPVAAASAVIVSAAVAAGSWRLPSLLDDPRPDVLLVTVDAVPLSVSDELMPSRPPGSGSATRLAWAPSSWTLPSLASLFTGQAPHHTGAGRDDHGFHALPDDALTLAERLRDRGYRTVALSAGNPFTGFEHGLLQGFDEVWRPWGAHRAPLPRGRSPHARPRTLAARLTPREATPDDHARAMASRAELALARRGAPTFVWLHLMDVHLPHAHPPCEPEILGAPDARSRLIAEPSFTSRIGRRCLHASYRDAAVAVRAALSRLVTVAVAEDAVVAITADHGEALGDPGAGFEHGHTLHPDVTRVRVQGYGHRADLPPPDRLRDLGVWLETRLGLPARPPTGSDVLLWGTLYGRPEVGVVRDGFVWLRRGDTTRVVPVEGGEPEVRTPFPDLAAKLDLLQGSGPSGPVAPTDAERLRALGYAD